MTQYALIEILRIEWKESVHHNLKHFLASNSKIPSFLLHIQESSRFPSLSSTNDPINIRLETPVICHPLTVRRSCMQKLYLNKDTEVL